MLSDPLGDNEELPLKDVRPNDGSHEEEGNVSDPGPASSFRPKRGVSQGELSFKQDDGRERERLLARRRMILDRSVRETRMVQSVDDEELRRIILREQEIRKGRAEIHELRSRLDTLLVAEPFRSERQHNSRSVSLQELEGGKSRLADLETAGRSQCTRKRELLATRRSHLKKARDIFQAKEQALRKSKAYHLLDMDVYRSILLSISQRRAGLISELSTIFPVELVDAANVLFSICGVPLPNGDSIQASLQTSTGLDLDEDHISSALGYVAQAVQLLAAYLTIPLYYPIKCMGSRSLVQDPISQMKGPKIFPLYSKGVDRYRFEYAVFLLNKDIEQIMLEHSIGVMDLTQTLPNLKNIYLTLSSDAIMRWVQSLIRQRDMSGRS